MSEFENLKFYCESMMIVNEDFKSVKNEVARTIQNLITRLLAFLKRLMYNLYRIRKVSIPKEIYQYILDMDKALTLILRGMDSGKTGPADAATLLDMVKTNKKFTQIMYSTKDAYNNSVYVDVNTATFVNNMKDINKQLTKKQVELNNLEYVESDSNDDSIAITDMYVKVLQQRLNVVSKVFTYHKNTSDVVPLDNATITDDYKI